MSKVPALTFRQQYWIAHLEACAKRGQPLAVYAREHSVSLSGLYEAKSSLRRRGLWPAASARFVRVESVASAGWMCRISLPNGVVVETAGGELSAVLSAAAAVS